MSKIKLTGHASGSGVLTIAAPNTDSDRTITLPDVTGTLLDSGSDLPAANLTGTVADARISAVTASKLTGALPAISGAALTGIDAATVATTAPGSPSEGDLWFNSASSTVSSISSKAMAVYNGTGWEQMSNKFSATGGTVTSYSGYKSHTFTSSGTFVADTDGTVDVMIVAGGGGGGGRWHGGGGGAGGVRVLTSQAVAAGSHTVTIGAGGGDVAAENVQGNDGTNSSFGSLAATGGGGGSGFNLSGRAGGSGGGDNGGDDSINDSPGAGNAGSYSPVEGYAGANTTGNGAYVAGGGGGGAGAIGGNSNKISDGGDGINNSYKTGSNIGYGGGGCGSNGYSSTGQSGTPAATHGGGAMDTTGSANTGGGGGAGSGTSSAGKGGGSGIVVIRYAV